MGLFKTGKGADPAFWRMEIDMWQSGWTWLKTLRTEHVRGRPDLADMGIEIGLDASLESRLPPLLEVAASRTRGASDTVSPLGTDRRSHFA